MTDATAPDPAFGLRAALPFWMSLVFVPMIAAGAAWGGLWLVLIPAWGFVVMSLADALTGQNRDNMDPQTQDAQLRWYRLITLIWLPIHLGLIFGALAVVSHTSHLAWWEEIALMVGVGMVSGTVGITYAHELIHQKSRLERALGEVMLIAVLYGHFRSEHIIVHHRYVGTPRDPVTARFKESFYHFFPRVLLGQIRSAWQAETARLDHRGLGHLHRSNPFWRYGLGSAAMLGIAFAIGGLAGIALFVLQAFFAVLQLELVNYIEHYGLTRKHLGDGKYEHTQPHHSWNAAHRYTNYLLINLQRHSDHHVKPDRRFPLLQTYDEADAPQLPHGYPLMIALALNPPMFRRRMNPLVWEWRRRHYPEISYWKPYTQGTTPMPR